MGGVRKCLGGERTGLYTEVRKVDGASISSIFLEILSSVHFAYLGVEPCTLSS